MKVFKLYDYIFFRLASFYEKQHGNEDRFGSILLLSFTQSSNLTTIICLIFLILDKKVELPYYVTVLFGIVFFFVFNFIRYKLFTTYQNLEKTWSSETESTRLKRGFYMIVFISLSLFLSALIASFTM